MPEQETDPAIVESAATQTPAPAETATPAAAQPTPDTEDRRQWTDAQWIAAMKGKTPLERDIMRDERASNTRSARWEEQVGQHIPTAMREAHRGDFWRAVADQFHPDYPQGRAFKNDFLREPIAGRFDRLQFRVKETGASLRDAATSLRGLIGR